MFNTLKYAKKLEEVGVSRPQAEAQVQIIAEILEDDMATKDDVKGLKGDIQNLKNDFENLRSELKNDMTILEHRLVIKLGTIVTIVTATATTIIKLL
jgi:hypothetical protein